MEAEDDLAENASHSYSGEGAADLWMSGELSDAGMTMDAAHMFRKRLRPPTVDSASVGTGSRIWPDAGRDRQSVRSGFDHSDENTEDQSNDALLPRGKMDVQLEVAVRYKGNMMLKIATELIINQPTENFMTLPMTLTLTSLTFSGLFACGGAFGRKRTVD
jgi:hypothetical protein